MYHQSNKARTVRFRVLTRFCWVCLFKAKRTRVFSQPTSRSPFTGQDARATGCSDRGISMISICTPPQADAPRSKWPSKRTPTRAFSSAWTKSRKYFTTKNLTEEAIRLPVWSVFQSLSHILLPWNSWLKTLCSKNVNKKSQATQLQTDTLTFYLKK